MKRLFRWASQLSHDLDWLYAMWRLRRITRGLIFSRRMAFFRALDPRSDDGHPLAWPDAMIYLTAEHVDTAAQASAKHVRVARPDAAGVRDG